MSLNHSPAIVTDGLVLCLDAGNSRSYPKSGTTWTDLKGGNNGTLTNMDGANFSSDNGGGLIFDGTDEYVNCGTGSNIFPTDSPFSISLWVNQDVTSSSNVNPRGFFSINKASTNERGINFWNQNTKVAFRIAPAGTNAGSQFNSSTTPTVGLWSHWTAVFEYDAATAVSRQGVSKIYYNGNFETSEVDQSPTVLSADAVIGANEGGTAYYLDGKVSYVTVYNRALSADEVRRNYEATVGRYT